MMKTFVFVMGRRLAKWAIEYIKTDQGASYGLAEKATAVFEGDGVGIGFFEDDELRIDSVMGGDLVKLTAQPFSARLNLWNGPDVIPDYLDDGAFEMSLWHDFIWVKADAIAAATGLTRAEVLAWGNGILHAAYLGYGRRKPEVPIALNLRARVAFHLCEAAKHVYHPVKRVVKALGRFFVVLAVAGSVAGCSGCSSPPDWTMTDASEVVVEEAR